MQSQTVDERWHSRGAILAAEPANGWAWIMWQHTWRSPDEIAARCAYYQVFNRASCASRKR